MFFPAEKLWCSDKGRPYHQPIGKKNGRQDQDLLWQSVLFFMIWQIAETDWFIRLYQEFVSVISARNAINFTRGIKMEFEDTRLECLQKLTVFTILKSRELRVKLDFIVKVSTADYGTSFSWKEPSSANTCWAMLQL